MLTWKAHDGPIYDILFTPDGRLLTSGGSAITLWDVNSRNELMRWEGAFIHTAIAVSPDGQYFGRSGNSEIAVWSVGEREPLFQEHGLSQSIAFLPDGHVFVANGESQEPIRRWAIPGGGERTGG